MRVTVETSRVIDLDIDTAAAWFAGLDDDQMTKFFVAVAEQAKYVVLCGRPSQELPLLHRRSPHHDPPNRLLDGALRPHMKMEEYTTGTNQHLWVHAKSECKGPNCVIHNPSDHPMRDFPTHWREDRAIMERICPHLIGHPDPDDVAFHKAHGGDISVHGCDGCCRGSKEDPQEGFALGARPLCVFCNAPWTDDMITVYDIDASRDAGSYDMGPYNQQATVDITCSSCKRLIYRKEFRE